MDVLSDVLQRVRLKGALFFDAQCGERVIACTPPMDQVGSAVMPGAEHVIPFHVMLEGECFVETFDSDVGPVEFKPGDTVLYPHGHGHIIVTELGDRAEAQVENYDRSRYERIPVECILTDEGSPQIHFVCGYFACDAKPFNPLLEALPPQVVAQRDESDDPVEIALIRSALAEGAQEGEGSEAILARLSELLFLRILRRYIRNLPQDASGWLAGLRDPLVARTLGLIHRDPAAEWTLEKLAKEAGSSRAVLAERFQRVVGETPIRYLAKWRMQRAGQLLRESSNSIGAVANDVGYASEAAFQRAFKKIVGVPPGQWRREAA